ncbi:hypothetical protein PR048_023837 [Dryococelus australis]|uniref:Uncharacterized protein n=1 Tax=Dryococelus australis TaxID=614101 RepID=A0ABQ9GV63_9NEOP|nr:hypothetical protein PR048_023837 [Dryococelus australis]
MAAATAQLSWRGRRIILQQAATLAEKALTDPMQCLIRATCADLAHIRSGFEEDHLLIAYTVEEAKDFDEDEHSSKLDVFDDTYYQNTAMADTLA